MPSGKQIIGLVQTVTHATYRTHTHQSLAHAASRCAPPDTQFEQASRLLTADISKTQSSGTCCTIHAGWYCGQLHMLCDSMYYVGGGLYAHLPVFALAATSCSLKLRGAQQLVAQRRNLDLELLTAVTQQQGADKLPAGYSHLARCLRMPPNNDTRSSFGYKVSPWLLLATEHTQQII